MRMSFSTRLKELRNSRNLTQKTVAEAVGMAPMAYQRYEYGTREPAFQQLIALADYFDVSLDYLLGRTDEPSLSSNVIGGDVTGGTVVQGANRSSVVVHNGSERTLTVEETELLRLFNAVDVKRRMKLLNLAFSLEEEIKSELSEQN